MYWIWGRGQTSSSWCRSLIYQRVSRAPSLTYMSALSMEQFHTASSTDSQLLDRPYHDEFVLLTTVQPDRFQKLLM